MQHEILEKMNKRYLNLVKRIQAEYRVDGKSNFKGITSDLLSVLHMLSFNPGEHEDLRESYISHLKALRAYINLIRRFEDFRSVEVSDGPYFPDAEYGDTRDYVCFAKLSLYSKLYQEPLATH
ncbi:MAG TPA: hypothetical protein VJI46_04020 [Candidatus Nanoarchaeia archaeon]|nr:hypothetical protein [Candidatus Nanoarchaeia archaeon]